MLDLKISYFCISVIYLLPVLIGLDAAKDGWLFFSFFFFFFHLKEERLGGLQGLVASLINFL